MAIMALLLVFSATSTGAVLGGSAATMTACAAILLLGLPHGTLDLELMKRQRAIGPARMAIVIIVYLALAAVMYAVWRAAPVTALVIFISIAIVHFSEDWSENVSAFLGQGVALSILAAPAFFHRAEMQALFVGVTGEADAAFVADLMLMLAPVSLAVAVVTLAAIWREGCRMHALAGLSAIVGMALLPPAVGFATFFCLSHSPRHFRAALTMLKPSGPRQIAAVVVLLTMAAIGLAAHLFAREVRANVTDQWVVASFMTLSLLTVPHMAVPALFAALDRRGDRRAAHPLPGSIALR